MMRMTKLWPALLLAGTLAGCAGQQSKPDTAPVEPVSEAEKAQGERNGLPIQSGEQTSGVEVVPIQSDTGEAVGAGLSPDEMQAGAAQPDQAMQPDAPVIYFGFDSDQVGEQGRATIKFFAQKLLDEPDVRVRLEGHTDERGSPEYNLALGERRARAVAQILELYGVTPDRIEIVSYGETKPAVEGHDEAAWAKNRRVEMVFIR
jgi:peptidoglycan-associated lipoprotein